jgi:hypothetical protein
VVQPVVEKLGCGRVRGRAENDPHSQGATIECLSTKIDEVNHFFIFFLAVLRIRIRFRTGSGSTCFWATWIRIRIHKSEVWIRLWIRIRILLSLSKTSKKNLDFNCFVTSFWLFTFVK